MSKLRRRPARVLVALIGVLLLALISETAVLALAFRVGGTPESTRVASDKVSANTTAQTWTDIPSMSVGFVVPADTHAVFLATFSGATTRECNVRVLIGSSELAPGEVYMSDPGSVYYAPASMQFVSQAMVPGAYTIKAQYRTPTAGSHCGMYGRVLSVTLLQQ